MAVGLPLAIAARPSLVETIALEDKDVYRFLGATANALRTITDSTLLHALAIAGLAVVGAA
jgi:hypothetical protein